MLKKDSSGIRLFLPMMMTPWMRLIFLLLLRLMTPNPARLGMFLVLNHLLKMMGGTFCSERSNLSIINLIDNPRKPDEGFFSDDGLYHISSTTAFKVELLEFFPNRES